MSWLRICIDEHQNQYLKKRRICRVGLPSFSCWLVENSWNTWSQFFQLVGWLRMVGLLSFVRWLVGWLENLRGPRGRLLSLRWGHHSPPMIIIPHMITTYDYYLDHHLWLLPTIMITTYDHLWSTPTTYDQSWHTTYGSETDPYIWSPLTTSLIIRQNGNHKRLLMTIQITTVLMRMRKSSKWPTGSDLIPASPASCR